MNKYLSFAAGAALLMMSPLCLNTASYAQGASPAFQDVPANHWAYQAVGTLGQAGIITPDQDSMFHGNKVITRYEFALAVSRVLAKIVPIDTSQFAKDSDLQAMESSVNDKLSANETAMSALSTLVNGLQPELDQIAKDDAAVKDRLDAFEKRLDVVQAEQHRVSIRGEAISQFRDNINGSNHLAPFLDADGYRVGTQGVTSAFSSPGFNEDILIGFDAQLSPGRPRRAADSTTPVADVPVVPVDAHHSKSGIRVSDIAARMPDYVTSEDLQAVGRYRDFEIPRSAAQFHAIIDWQTSSGYTPTTSFYPNVSSSYFSGFSVTSNDEPNILRAYAQFPIQHGSNGIPLIGCWFDCMYEPMRLTTGSYSKIDSSASSSDESTPTTSGYGGAGGGGWGSSSGYGGGMRSYGGSNYSVGDVLDATQYGRHIELDTNRYSGLTVGVLGEKFTPFTLQSNAPHTYYDMPEYRDGDVRMDGFKFQAGLRDIPLNINFYAGKVGNGDLAGGPSTNALSWAFRPGSLVSGGITTYNPIDQTAGLHVDYLGLKGVDLGGTALVARVLPLGISYGQSFDRARPAVGATYAGPIDPVKMVPYNTIDVLGMDAKANVLGIEHLKFNGEFAFCQTGKNSVFGNLNDSKNNMALYGHFDYTQPTWSVNAGYQAIYPNFAAPGYWGKVGDWTNPTNVKGPVVSCNYMPTKSLCLYSGFSLYNGIDNVGDQNPLGSKDTLDSAAVSANYQICPSYSVNAGYEWSQYNLENKQDMLSNSGKPLEQYINFGLQHPFNKQASLRLGYQYITYDDKNTGFDPSGNSRGQVLTSQFDYKF